jgi:hypothetical protein
VVDRPTETSWCRPTVQYVSYCSTPTYCEPFSGVKKSIVPSAKCPVAQKYFCHASFSVCWLLCGGWKRKSFKIPHTPSLLFHLTLVLFLAVNDVNKFEFLSILPFCWQVVYSLYSYRHFVISPFFG